MILDPISISEAAQILGVSPNRVRVLAVRGQLPAEKIGGRWLVERFAVERRAERKTLSGRLFEPHNAWALLFLASGSQVEGLDPSVRSRMRRALAAEGLIQLLPRLRLRAEKNYFKALEGEVPHILEDRLVVRSGISAVGDYGIDLVSGQEADCYLPASKLEGFVANHALVSGIGPANVCVRLVPDEAWHLLADLDVAPMAAVCLDLAEDEDARLHLVGRYLLEGLHGDLLETKDATARRADA
jgi:excisionase family DNA binding protein